MLTHFFFIFDFFISLSSLGFNLDISVYHNLRYIHLFYGKLWTTVLHCVEFYF